jgi:putative membrane protein
MLPNRTLAAADAGLTAASLFCLFRGWRAIKSSDIARHRAWMIRAAAFGAAFLVVFSARFYVYGVTEFQPKAVSARAFFWLVYFTHEPLAVINVAMGGAALALGLARRDDAHREIAPYAFWTWTYVAVTGLVLYVLLYVISGS